MNSRDLDYIEARLLWPAQGANEAYERLQKLRQDELARELMAALQTFSDTTSAIRRKLMKLPRAR